MEALELQVQPYVLPVIVSNCGELKNKLRLTVEKYKTMVYTADQLKVAKADRAALNKLKKALNDERIKREREYMVPFTEFKMQIDSLIALVDEPATLIDSQIKGYEEQKKAEKRQEIEKLFESIKAHEWLKIDQIFKPQWLNSSVNLKTIESEIKEINTGIWNDLYTIAELPAYAFEATEVYKQTLNIQTAINEGRRLAEIQRKKEEAQQREQAAECKVEEVSEIGEGVQVGGDLPPVATAAVADTVSDSGQWISFKACLTIAQALELKAFFQERGIEFMPI